MISRTSMFRSIVENAQLTLKQQITNIPKSAGINYQNFVNLNDVQKREVLTAIQSLKSYETSSKAQNDRRRKLFQRMSYKQQKACKDIGYLKKLDKIDNAISANYKFVNDVADHAIAKYGISLKDFDLLNSEKKNASTTSASNYRVIEALGHYTRDWHPENIGLELLPIYEYVALQLSALIPYDAKKDTCLVSQGQD